MLWFVAANNVAGASVVNGIHTRPMWGQFFWFVWQRGNDQRDLCTNFKRQCVGMLILVLRLGLVVSCSGADGSRRSADGLGVGVDNANGVDVAAVIVVAVVGKDGIVIDGVLGVGLHDRSWG